MTNPTPTSHPLSPNPMTNPKPSSRSFSLSPSSLSITIIFPMNRSLAQFLATLMPAFSCSFFIFFMTEPAYADLEICNQTSETLRASYARFYNGNWRTSGHYKLTSGECSVVLNAPLIYDKYYYYAQKSSDNPTHSGSSKGTAVEFCIDKKSPYEFMHDDGSVRNIEIGGSWGYCGENSSDYVFRSFRRIDRGTAYTDCVVELKPDGRSSWTCSAPGVKTFREGASKVKELLPWNW